jgi:hypothetical protein
LKKESHGLTEKNIEGKVLVRSFDARLRITGNWSGGRAAFRASNADGLGLCRSDDISKCLAVSMHFSRSIYIVSLTEAHTSLEV